MDSILPQEIILSSKVLVVHRSRLLLLRRSETHPTKALRWDIPGGVVEEGDSPEKTAIREIKEETSLQVKNIEIISTYHTSSHKTHNAPVLWLIYLAEALTDEVNLSQEHDKYVWIDPAKVKTYKLAKRYEEAVAKLINS